MPDLGTNTYALSVVLSSNTINFVRGDDSNGNRQLNEKIQFSISRSFGFYVIQSPCQTVHGSPLYAVCKKIKTDRTTGRYVTAAAAVAIRTDITARTRETDVVEIGPKAVALTVRSRTPGRGVYLQLYVALLQLVRVRLEFDVGQLVRGRRRLEVRVEQRIHQRGLAQTGLA